MLRPRIKVIVATLVAVLLVALVAGHRFWSSTLLQRAPWLVRGGLAAPLRDPNQQKLDAAERLQADGQLDDARHLLEELLKADPDNADAHYKLGNLLIHLKQINQGLDHLGKAAAARPTDAALLMEYAGDLADAGKTVQACVEYEAVLRVTPKDLVARLDLARLQTQQKHGKEAEANLRVVLAAQPENAEARALLGTALAEQGQREGAAAELAQAIRLKPDDPALHQELATAMGQQGQFEAAVAEFTKALQLEKDPKLLPFRHLSLGLALRKADKPDLAMAQFREAIRLDPNFVEARLNLADMLVHDHRADEAIPEYREAMKVRPRWPPTMWGLAWALVVRPKCNSKDAQEAVQLAKPAVAMTKARHPEALDVLAAAEARVGDYPAAIGEAERGVERAVQAGMSEMAREIQGRLAYYKAHQPYFDGAPVPPPPNLRPAAPPTPVTRAVPGVAPLPAAPAPAVPAVAPVP